MGVCPSPGRVVSSSGPFEEARQARGVQQCRADGAGALEEGWSAPRTVIGFLNGVGDARGWDAEL